MKYANLRYAGRKRSRDLLAELNAAMNAPAAKRGTDVAGGRRASPATEKAGSTTKEPKNSAHSAPGAAAVEVAPIVEVVPAAEVTPVKEGEVKQDPPRHAKCVHGVRKSRCLECGGSEMCLVHRCRKARCIPCGGAEICPHLKRKYRCPDCRGTYLPLNMKFVIWKPLYSEESYDSD